LRLIYLRCGERCFVPKAAVSNCSKQQLYSITSSARASSEEAIVAAQYQCDCHVYTFFIF